MVTSFYFTTIAANLEICDCRYHFARINVSRNAFFGSRSEKQNKNIFFDVDIVVKKQFEMWFAVVCTLIDNEYASLLFSQTFFSYCFCMLSEFAKVYSYFKKGCSCDS